MACRTDADQDVFDYLAVSTHRDGCKHETGYPSFILRHIFNTYRTAVFGDGQPTPSGFGRATQEEVDLFLLYKYIHVRDFLVWEAV